MLPLRLSDRCSPWAFGIALAATTVAGPVHADATHECIAASDEGQQLRDGHKLSAARERFVTCARDECPALIRSTCQRWLAEVTAQQPTIVVGVRDSAGHDIVHARILIDGAVVSGALDGSPIAIDPGQHVLRLETEAHAPVEQTLVARQGERNREVTIVLDGPAPAAAPVPVAQNEPAAVVAAVPDSTRARPRTWNTIGWILGGAGVLGLVTGGVFGVVAIVENNKADCRPGGPDGDQQCLPGPLSSAKTAAAGSDIGLIAGGALLAGGVTLILTSPKKRGDATAHAEVRIAPLLGPRTGGLSAVARF